MWPVEPCRLPIISLRQLVPLGALCSVALFSWGVLQVIRVLPDVSEAGLWGLILAVLMRNTLSNYYRQDRYFDFYQNHRYILLKHIFTMKPTSTGITFSSVLTTLTLLDLALGHLVTRFPSCLLSSPSTWLWWRSFSNFRCSSSSRLAFNSSCFFFWATKNCCLFWDILSSET